MLTPTPAGVEIDVRVIPRSRRTELAGTRDGRLLVRVSAPPVEDAANDALIDLIARTLAIPKRSVRIVAGQRSRQKRIAVEGITAEAASRLVAG